MVKILIADDSAFMRTILKRILTIHGYENIIEAADGTDAVGKFKTEKPDLVLLDIIMPGMGGLDALRAIMKFDPNANAVMVTAVGQEAMISEARDAGAKGYIIKPFDEEKILEKVKAVLSGE